MPGTAAAHCAELIADLRENDVRDEDVKRRADADIRKVFMKILHPEGLDEEYQLHIRTHAAYDNRRM